MKPKPGGGGRMNYGTRTYPKKLGTGDSMSIRIVDPDSLNPDPDPAFQVNPDPDTNPRF